ncbi:hypothetical protein DKAM_0875 [Desulfurococcus amylolyticus 1221n]|uniref:Uncharacterized protein n=1 Tax=Desulfurococcus amylolyticus (strain DSM 18924 / JCM 16383 / VKM B-2413 / 1221n) TaxID=490899 RepID=B8D520_DESA1|nr:hypothetical protein DKAM_0875 [Desulfurococcus amylolyticus 1221n]
MFTPDLTIFPSLLAEGFTSVCGGARGHPERPQAIYKPKQDVGEQKRGDETNLNKPI